MSKGEIRKLRRASHHFSYRILPGLLQEQFVKYGIGEDLFEIEVPKTQVSDQDPEIVYVNYKSVFEETNYLQSRGIG